MEVDRIMYIFGSFSRKKDKRKSFDQSSISAGNSPLHLTKAGRPASHNLDIPPRTSAYDDVSVGRRKSRVNEWECGLCKRELVEPRLLGCLHSFCTRCLQGLHQEGEVEEWNEIDGGSIQLEADSGTASGTGSAGSGYDSDLRHSGSDTSWEKKPAKYGIFTRKISGKASHFIICPRCSYETPLPLGGVSALPVNHVLLRQMAQAQQEQDEAVNVLCDLCSTDNKAESRCTQCVVSVCQSCKELHRRQKATARHSMLPLDPQETKHCTQHPRAELTVYCATCQVVVCRECGAGGHAGHALAHAGRAAAERARALRDAAQRARRTPAHLHALRDTLQQHAADLDSHAARVESEIQSWAEQYKRAVEAHGRALGVAAARARSRQRDLARRRDLLLQERARHAADAVHFAEELLSTAKEDELLSLSGPVLRRLERVTDLSGLTDPPQCELRFSPTTVASHDSTLVGRLFTRPPDPNKCVLNTEGFQDLRVDCPHEATLEIRDSNGEKIWCGGEQVSGYIRRRDSSARPGAAAVRARPDGRYGVLVAAPAPGNYLLAVTVNNTPIQGSPFPCAVRRARSHSGRWRCCALCSADTHAPGCSASQPNWPGPHWSCCGSTQRNGICTANNLYHVSL